MLNEPAHVRAFSFSTDVSRGSALESTGYAERLNSLGSNKISCASKGSADSSNKNFQSEAVRMQVPNALVK